MAPRDPDVIVVGAGASGLAAASMLAAGGLDVVVLEARDRIGGRVLTNRVSDVEAPIELGAEFVHGEALPIREIAGRHHLAMVDIADHHMISSRGRLLPAANVWERIGRVMRRLDANRAVDRSFADALRANKKHFSATDRALAIQFVEGFEAGDPADISERALAEAGLSGDDVRESRAGRLIDGYASLIDCLAAPVLSRIELGTVVSAIRWRRGRVDVECRDRNGAPRVTVSARAIVVTVPIGVLKATPGSAGAIEIQPSIPSIERAVALTAMGAIVKLALRFERAFWLDRHMADRLGRPDLDQMSFVQTAERLPFPVWWTSYPVRAPILVAWRGGTAAASMSYEPLDKLEARAVESLAAMLSLTPRAVRKMLVATFHHDWVNDPFSRGAYSYSRVGGDRAPQALARPVQNTVWFAGEATDIQPNIGTVHGAIASGWRAARQILRRS